jgi:hypothetical protein
MYVKKLLPVALLAAMAAGCAQSRIIRVPVFRETHGAAPELIAQAKKLQEADQLLTIDDVKSQLDKKSCWLSLPDPKTKPLAGRDIWDVARKAHVRIGYFFLCHKCKNWHMELAGGYAITANGAVATCYHVIKPKDVKEGYLVASTEAGEILPVTEILAANEFTDAAIVRVRTTSPLEPLPLNTSIVPGDPVWCFSDPADRAGFFSDGIVNRFYRHWHGAKAKEKFPLRMNVSTEWAPGSSGAAVLDRYGNAVGHVTAITPHGARTGTEGSSEATNKDGKTLLVFHDAVCAADVLALLKRPANHAGRTQTRQKGTAE